MPGFRPSLPRGRPQDVCPTSSPPILGCLRTDARHPPHLPRMPPRSKSGFTPQAVDVFRIPDIHLSTLDSFRTTDRPEKRMARAARAIESGAGHNGMWRMPRRMLPEHPGGPSPFVFNYAGFRQFRFCRGKHPGCRPEKGAGITGVQASGTERPARPHKARPRPGEGANLEKNPITRRLRGIWRFLAAGCRPRADPASFRPGAGCSETREKIFEKPIIMYFIAAFKYLPSSGCNIGSGPASVASGTRRARGPQVQRKQMLAKLQEGASFA
jgi:hypothetical protein